MSFELVTVFDIIFDIPMVFTKLLRTPFAWRSSKRCYSLRVLNLVQNFSPIDIHRIIVFLSFPRAIFW